MTFLSRFAALCVLLATSGCTALLPRGSGDTPSPFESYGEAQQAAERIVPFETGVAQLSRLGFDPEAAKNVTVIPYPEIIGRLAPNSSIPIEHLDPGIRACIRAQTACRGYLFRFLRQDRKREGNFLADFLNVHRLTHYTGWSFEALVVVSEGVVLFRNTGGEPRVERFERQTNPLGPLQPAGEAVGAIILR